MAVFLNKLKRSLMGSKPTAPISPVLAVLEHDKGNRKSSDIAAPSENIELTDNSMSDGLYEVEQILAHQGNWKLKSKMRFLVRWKGC